jgi:hypothetical protein
VALLNSKVGHPFTAMEMLSSLSKHGYAELHNLCSLDEALSVTSTLGDVTPLNGEVTQKLIPLDRGAVSSRSFTSRFGRELFPLHTDTAFWIRPARFVVFFMENASCTATNVLSVQDSECLVEFCRKTNPVFTRQTTRGIIYSRPWTENDGGRLVYDPCYMRPENQSARDFEGALNDLLVSAKRICWPGRKALVIDNWRVLHGRERCSDMTRVLFRFYRGGKNELGA